MREGLPGIVSRPRSLHSCLSTYLHCRGHGAFEQLQRWWQCVAQLWRVLQCQARGGGAGAERLIEPPASFLVEPPASDAGAHGHPRAGVVGCWLLANRRTWRGGGAGEDPWSRAAGSRDANCHAVRGEGGVEWPRLR